VDQGGDIGGIGVAIANEAHAGSRFVDCCFECPSGGRRIAESNGGPLSKYEMGQSVPTLALLLRLRAHSGRSIDWIVTGEGGGPGKT
jgi:hypothetical protein